MTTPTAADSTPRDRRRASGADLRAALQSSAIWLSANAERVNALNVFPVPDGDTGTNMSLTLEAAVAALGRLPASAGAGEVARAAYEAAMLGARGNSGVILSQLLRGFSEALKGAEDLTPDLLATALEQASQAGYEAVSRPVEGTMLTVARLAAEGARAAADAGRDLPDVLEQAQEAATAAVADTPNQLEVLRKAGVVDSGGEGYRLVVEGAWMWSTGRSLEESSSVRPDSHALLDQAHADGSSFGFCTEFLLRASDVPCAEVKQHMEGLGDSVIAVGDANLLRVHVHTPRPGQVLEYAVDHGTLVKVKVENMQEQHEAFAARSAQADGAAAEDSAAQLSTIGVIAVVAGEGLARVFRSLGATVVQGGQTMNPSVQEILSAVNRAGFKEVIILPNNSNIVLTARQVQDLTPHAVAVVATATAPQGIGALLAFNYQADLQTNVAAMEQAAHAVHTLEITPSVRDAEVDGQAVRAGDVLCLYDGRLVTTATSADEALFRAFDHLDVSVDALEIVTIYYGAEATEAQAVAVAARIRDAHPGLAVEVVSGGQPHYPFVVSLE